MVRISLGAAQRIGWLLSDGSMVAALARREGIVGSRSITPPAWTRLD
jgi:hypothetical protein